jgi:hypothetical protein
MLAPFCSAAYVQSGLNIVDELLNKYFLANRPFGEIKKNNEKQIV